MTLSQEQQAEASLCQNCGEPKPAGRGRKLCDACTNVGTQIINAKHAVQKQLVRTPRPAKVNDKGQVWCPRCQQYLALKKFGSGLKIRYCKACERDYNLDYRLRTVYGITRAEYDRMLALQGGRCAICRNQPRRYALAVDHDHQTGVIRGLLCVHCNHNLLGGAHDDVEILKRAVDYLLYPPAQQLGGI